MMMCYYNNKRGFGFGFGFWFWFSLAVVVVVVVCPAVVGCKCARRRPVIFNFGDSNSDTGGFAAANGFEFGYPYGRAFFHEPTTGRLSDGRLIIDFLCESLETSYLKPYVDSVASAAAALDKDSSKGNGMNFAVSGAATLPSFSLFNLGVQINQFRLFQNRSLYLGSQSKEDFKEALYIFDIGENDLYMAFASGIPYDQVLGNISSVVSGIKDAMWGVYRGGGRKFWVHNTGPLGCLPQQLGLRKPNASQVDEYGCIAMLNEGAKAFNSELARLCRELRLQMKDATVVYVDVYAIKHGLVADGSFEKPLMACCGHGGPPYNYDPKIRCLVVPGYTLCKNGSRYISWDGIHYSEAANRIVASKILSNTFSTPALNFNFFCN